MRITNVKINGITNPVGFLYEKLFCSWNVCETESKKAVNTVIEVSKTENFAEILYKKEGTELCQSGELLDISLEARTRYFYRITVTGDRGDQAISAGCFFETGKMDETWNAQWIALKAEDSFHPILKKTFYAKENIKKARLYVTGVGLFEAYLNGKKIGNEYLMPYITDYEQTLQVLTFPVEEYVAEGENTLEILLGKGWYMGVFGLKLTAENYGNRMAAIGELHLEYADGEKTVIGTDKSWTYKGSDVEDSGIYLGETLNRQLWQQKENAEKAVEVLADENADDGIKNLKKKNLKDRLSLPVIEKEKIAVKEVLETPAKETVLDMGQNFAGFVEFQADFPVGTKIVLEFGEILQEGNFYNKNYRDAEARFVYISDGCKETVRPHFTFFGFRYVKVTGWPGSLRKEDFCGKVLYSDIQRTGYIKTNNPKINRLYENTVWGLKSNFLDMPTDCPQRSERLGWTGDAQVFVPTASYHMDTRAFFHKFIADLKKEQELLNGGMPNFLPNIGHTEKAGSVWGDIATFLPYTVYTYYGNAGEMEFAYPMMKEWVEWITRQCEARDENNYLFTTVDTFGDWLALDGATPTSFKGSTEDAYISSVYYYRSVQIVREMAECLQKDEDAKRYKMLEEAIREAILHEYFTPGGKLAADTQAAYVIALKFGVYVDKERLVKEFKTRLKKDLHQIKCGFVGAPLLCTVLAEVGEYELAYDFLLKEDFPSWLYSVNLGATTIWERWNSVGPDGVISNTGMNSLNHYAYGSVMEFVYAYVAGIRPLEPGFRRAIIEPHPDVRLSDINCTYESVNGRYVCNWKIQSDGRIKAYIEIPFGCEAEVVLPSYEREKMVLAAGAYEFLYQPQVDLRKGYSENTTLRRLSQDEKAMAILKKYVPVLAGIAASKDPEMGENTLAEIRKITYLPFNPQQLEMAIKEICELKCSTKAFIFDLDGVLVFTDKFHYQAWKKMADDMGIYFDETINNQLRGVSRAESLEIILKQYEGEPLTDKKKKALMEEKNATYRELLKTMTAEDVSEEVRDTLTKLREAGYKLAVGSSSKNAKYILEKTELLDFFDAISDGTNITNSKPDPEVFVKAGEFLEIEPGQCVVVEDAYAGIDAAKAANMQAVGIGDAAGYEKADYQISNFRELLKVAGVSLS